MNDNDAAAVVDGEQAKMALERWLGPAFDYMIGVWRERLEVIAASEPWAKDKITNLASAIKAAQESRKQIEMVVREGEVALASERRRKHIENLPTHKRKWALM